MKTKMVFILTLILSSYAPEPEIKVVPVINIQKFDFDKPGAYPECYKDGDVVFYRAAPPKNALWPRRSELPKNHYWLAVYKKKGKKLECFRDYNMVCDCVIDSAQYKWVNDSTVKFRLIYPEYPLYSYYFIIHSVGLSESILGTKEAF